MIGYETTNINTPGKNQPKAWILLIDFTQLRR